MKQLTLTGITVRDEDELELPFKVQIKATISQGPEGLFFLLEGCKWT